MKVLIADKLEKEAVTALTAAGITVDYDPEAGAKGLTALADHDVLVVRSSKVSGDVIRNAKNLQLVVRAGAGVNTIDVAAASSRGVFVTNCPGKNAIAVAELTFALMLGLDRRVHRASNDLTAGRWNKKEYAKADGVFGKTLGVVGLGQIGREVAARAASFGLNVVAWSRSLTDESAAELGVVRAPDLLTLAAKSDIVSVHVAHTADTKHCINAAFLAMLPEHAMLINMARDGIVDEQAVTAAMKTRGLRYASDVFDGEPSAGEGPFVHALAGDPAVLATPHIGASTQQAQNAVAAEAVRIITTFTRTGQALNCVNLCKQSPAQWQLNVRHLDRVGVLANVLGSLRESNINVEEVENVIFDGAEAASARIRLGGEPPADLVARIGQYDHVLDARLVRLSQ
ncbi:MAG: phosphoglycerate dehydrogenase [Myxococcota bacterium]|nr:phosphoglycerate dehydrogenase [Myxococcota bacterium]